MSKDEYLMLVSAYVGIPSFDGLDYFKRLAEYYHSVVIPAFTASIQIREAAGPTPPASHISPREE